MGVTYGIHCATCRVYGPVVGDWGFIGFPALELGTRRGYLTFGAIYEPLRALGAINTEVAAIHAFLVAHKEHALDMNGDGIDWEPSGVPEDVADRFEYSGPWDEGRYLVRCSDCEASFQSQRDAFVPFGPRNLSRAAIAAALRLLRKLADNHDNVWGFPFDADQASSLADFLRAHREHSLEARLDTDTPTDGALGGLRVLEEVWSHTCPVATQLVINDRFAIAFSQHGVQNFDARTGALAWSDNRDHGAGMVFLDPETLWAARRGLWDPQQADPPPNLVELNASTGVQGRTLDSDFEPMTTYGDAILGRRFVSARVGFEMAVLNRDAHTLWSVAGPGYEHYPWRGAFVSNDIVVLRGDAVECRGGADGRLRWRRPFEEFGGPRPLAPMPLDERTVLVSASNSLVALNTQDGATRWHRPFGWQAILIDADRALLAGERLTVCDPETGAVRAEIDVREEMSRLTQASYRGIGQPLICLGWIVLVDESHRLWVFDPETLRAVGSAQPKRTLPAAMTAIALGDCIYTSTWGLDGPSPSIYCHRLLLPRR